MLKPSQYSKSPNHVDFLKVHEHNKNNIYTFIKRSRHRVKFLKESILLVVAFFLSQNLNLWSKQIRKIIITIQVQIFQTFQS